MKDDVLLQHIRRRFPDATIAVTEFPSGAVDVAIRRRGCLVVVQYTDGSEYGVSPIGENDLAFTGHDNVYPSAAEAIAKLDELLS